MTRVWQIGAMLLAGAVVGLCDQPPPSAKSPKSAPPPTQPRNNVAPKGVVPKQGPPLMNPETRAARLFRMTPEQRERLLEQLPPKMQENFKQQIAAFDRLPKEEQEFELHQLDRFEQLPPERKLEFKDLYQQLKQLPRDRAPIVRQALRRIEVMPTQQRQNLFNSPTFQARFSPDEQKLIAHIAAIWFP